MAPGCLQLEEARRPQSLPSETLGATGVRNCSSVVLEVKEGALSPLWALLRGMRLQGAGFGSLFYYF